VKAEGERFFNQSMLWFLLIGAGNAGLTILLMLGLYSLLHLGYWLSSGTAFFVCSIISYHLNKRISFKNDDAVIKTSVKFALVIAVSYLAAYSAARPLTAELLERCGLQIDQADLERIAMLVGQVVFTAVNYLGQRYFAFAKK